MRAGGRRGAAVRAAADRPGAVRTVRVERAGPVTTVVLDRPESRNAVDSETAAALADAFRAFEADVDARVAVLWGAGGTFCAGADLKAIGSGRGNRLESEGDGPMGPSRMLLSKPTIAAVAGYAVAVTSGNDSGNKDFGNYRNGSISGMKFEDANADGSKTGDTGPAVSFNIRIYKDNGTTPGSLDAGDTPVDTVATVAGTGLWSKAGLKPGAYLVCEESKAGWTQSAPSNGDTTGRVVATADANRCWNGMVGAAESAA